ncbi:MAG: hypothetical protein M1814_002370 [Vezdaea aestivalis]|nr:MAG: hypothetical protein M1814_002370 [Vezdaea aestivalis]
MGALRRISKRLVLSYILDWMGVIVIAAIGGGINGISGNRRPFSLTNPEISFPFTKEKVSTVTLVMVSLVAPAAIIFLVCLLLVPGSTVPNTTPKSLIWRRKFWEWNTGWLGLALALASAFTFVQGTKNMFGKPRPDLLSRCMPDLSRLDSSRVGWGNELVSWTICSQTDESIMKDAFRSFPSGHASFSSAGLTYIALWLASKFAVAIPFTLPITFQRSNSSITSAFPSRLHHRKLASPISSTGKEDSISHQASDSAQQVVPLRNRAASPPIYLLMLTFVPLATAIYISSTRYSDFRHHGFDIIIGWLLGLFFAWFGFRWTHLPIRSGAGWSWGARSRDRAFGIGVGKMGYVGEEGWESSGFAKKGDIEMAESGLPHADSVTGPGRVDRLEGGETNGA